jgi:hypothetical protein
MGNRQNLPHSQLTEIKLKNKTTHLQKKSSATFTEKTLRGRGATSVNLFETGSRFGRQ